MYLAGLPTPDCDTLKISKGFRAELAISTGRVWSDICNVHDPKDDKVVLDAVNFSWVLAWTQNVSFLQSLLCLSSTWKEKAGLVSKNPSYCSWQWLCQWNKWIGQTYRPLILLIAEMPAPAQVLPMCFMHLWSCEGLTSTKLLCFLLMYQSGSPQKPKFLPVPNYCNLDETEQSLFIQFVKEKRKAFFLCFICAGTRRLISHYLTLIFSTFFLKQKSRDRRKGYYCHCNSLIKPVKYFQTKSYLCSCTPKKINTDK